MVLSSHEYDLINLLATKSRQDWFCIKQSTRRGETTDYVYDLEEGKKMTLAKGIKYLVGELTEDTIAKLSADDKFALIGLLTKLL